jgi:hypothetical protein
MIALLSSALAAELKKGTPVTLSFDEGFSSRTAHKGDTVRLHVLDDVTVHNRVVIKRGTRVRVTITEVKKSGRFGKNGQIKMSIAPIRVGGVEIPLQPRQKGNMIGGTRGTKAAGAAAAGAFVLGPIGLGAGYFVVGHSVVVKRGDKFDTQVAEDVHLR